MQLYNITINGRMRIKALNAANEEVQDFVVELFQNAGAVNYVDFGKVFFYELPNGIIQYDTTSLTPATGFQFTLVDTGGNVITATNKVVVDDYESATAHNFQILVDQHTFTVAGAKYLEKVDLKYTGIDANNANQVRVLCSTVEPAGSVQAEDDPNNAGKKGIKLDGNLVSQFKVRLEAVISFAK